MTRRNLPDINPNGATFRGVRVHQEHRAANRRRKYIHTDDRATLSAVWRRVMAIVWRYQAAGFAVEYSERFVSRDGAPVADEADGHDVGGAIKVADIVITPSEK